MRCIVRVVLVCATLGAGAIADELIVVRSGIAENSRQLIALQDQNFDTLAALHYGLDQAARYSSVLYSAFEAFQRLNPLQNE